MASPTVTRVAIDVNFITFNDERLPPAAIVDPRSHNAFILTTGGFPQEVIFSTSCSTADVHSIRLLLQDAKDIVLEKSGTDSGDFQVIAQRTLDRGPPVTVKLEGEAPLHDFVKERISLDVNGAGKGIRSIKLRILSGYSDFVGIGGVTILGEESEKRVAVMEMKPEVSM